MCPQAVNRQARQEKIARAALTVFSKKGYAATSVREIAKAAGMGKGTLYEYFQTKADIFVAATKQWLNALESRFSIHVAGLEDPAERLTALAHAFVELVDPLDPMTARMSVEIIRQGVLQEGVLYDRRHELREVMLGTQKRVEQVLLEGISQGIFKAAHAKDVGKMAANFIGYLDGILLHSVMTKGELELKEHVDFFITTVLHFLSKPSGGPSRRGPQNADLKGAS